MLKAMMTATTITTTTPMGTPTISGIEKLLVSTEVEIKKTKELKINSVY